MSVPAISPASLPVIQQIPLAAATTGGPSAPEFGQILQSTINQVEQSQQLSSDAIGKFLSGEEGELHSTILATQKADMQLSLFLQVRNKVVGAYQEIMRMQL